MTGHIEDQSELAVDAASSVALNRYRNIDRDWEDLQAMRRRPIEVPALFVGGDRGRSDAVGAPQHRALPRHGTEHARRACSRRVRPLDPAGALRRGGRAARRVSGRALERFDLVRSLEDSLTPLGRAGGAAAPRPAAGGGEQARLRRRTKGLPPPRAPPTERYHAEGADRSASPGGGL